MILTCPSCGTQYVVKDGAIPPQGRQVRCAACKHSWHQEPESSAAAEGTEAMTAAEPAQTIVSEQPDMPADDEHESFAEASMIEPSSGPAAEERAYEEALIEETVEPEASTTAQPGFSLPPLQADDAQRFESPTATSDYDAPPAPEAQRDDDFSPFAERDYVEPRRNSPVLRILLVLLLIAALAAAFWFLAPPEWRARLGLDEASATPLTLVTTHMDRQKLESGNELLTVAGRVINPTSKSHSVPPIYAQLKSKTGKVIYSWTIAPPAPSLAPGASASFNSAEVNVPSGAEELTITLGAPKA